jgi:hypothetical protein
MPDPTGETMPTPEELRAHPTLDGGCSDLWCERCLTSDRALAQELPAPATDTPAARREEMIERIAAQVHEDWMAAKRAAGVTTRKLDTTGEELLVPYESLSEQAKELDRGTVRSVLSTLPKLGYHVATRPA